MGIPQGAFCVFLDMESGSDVLQPAFIRPYNRSQRQSTAAGYRAQRRGGTDGVERLDNPRSCCGARSRRRVGGDRAQRLAGRARQEGTLVLYTSLATSESVPLTQAFEKKYGVKIQLWRSLSDQVVQRVLNEARARRHNVDVVETNGPELEALARERVTARFFSPYIADIPAWGVPAHRMWISDRVDFFVVAFNTVKVRREELPATYEGFLDSKWKGRIGLEA